MQKARVLVSLVVLAVVAAIATFFILTRESTTRTQIPRREIDDFDSVLHALDVPFPVGQINEFDREVFAKGRKEREKAVEKLRQMGTNALPRLMEEVRTAAKIEVTNRTQAIDTNRRLILAFEVLGSDAWPLLPQLIEEFHAGRCIGASAAGIKIIGGTDAGLALVAGLTNLNPNVRYAAMSALSSFRTNNEVALAAVPFLLLRLQDDSGPARALAASVLGSLQVKPETVLPALMEVAQHDLDVVVRRTSIKAIGRFGTNAVSLEPKLEILATADQDEHTRRIAGIALQAVQGKLNPDSL